MTNIAIIEATLAQILFSGLYISVNMTKCHCLRDISASVHTWFESSHVLA